ncbi:hypothetical protein CFP56_022247, partial [Quercus suber]
MCKVLQRCEDTRPGLLERVITVCWGIWKNRNELRIGGKGKAGRTILRNAMNLVDEFLAANEPRAEVQDTRPGLLERVITVCWGIWKNRNELRIGGKGKAGRTILRNAMNLVDDGNLLIPKDRKMSLLMFWPNMQKMFEDYVAWLEECPSMVEH